MSGKRKQSAPMKKETPPSEKAAMKLRSGALSELACSIQIRQDDSYPMARDDWAYVTSQGLIYLNPKREATEGEWEYILAHCMLHLGLGHFQQEKMNDPLWVTACDVLVTRFLRDCRIGTPPLGFTGALPITAKSEDAAMEQLRALPEEKRQPVFSTMSGGRPDMVWTGAARTDYVETLSYSLQTAIQDTVREAAGLPPMERRSWWPFSPSYGEAREWFISHYPLLGALAASFRIVDDQGTVARLHVPVAAVCPQLKEIYINPACHLTYAEWQFVLAHEFLHAALRHDVRCEYRDQELWNVACDYVVNGWLVEMDIGAMPESALYDGQFSSMSVEAVYDSIYQEFRQYRKESNGDILYGDPGWWNTLDGGVTDDFYRSALQQGLAYHQNKERGDLPAGLVEEIYAISRPPIQWDVELARWFDQQFEPLEKHRSYARLSRRQSATPDIPRPAWRMEEGPVEQRIFGVLLDTSGSMDRGLLAAALGSIASYSQSRDVHHIRVVFCDAAAYDQGIMSPEDIARAVKVLGRGGTVLQPGIDLLDSDPQFPKDAPLLVITDGDCDRLNLRGRKHAYLIPWGNRLPFTPKGPVFRLK